MRDLLRTGYDAIPNARTEHGGRTSFPVRLLGRRAVVVRGHDTARHFYDQAAIRRRGAVPAPLAHLLFGRGAVHGLDGRAHQTRKQLFLDLLDEESSDELAQLVGTELAARAHRWRGHRHRVSVFEELVSCFGHCVQHWAGLPDPSDSVSRQLATIVDGFGGAGTAYPRAWRARWRIDRWARGLIDEVRAGRRAAAPGTALHTFALGAGSTLDGRLAAVELVNVLRPTVAVAWPATFGVVALADRSEWSSRFSEDAALRESFAHEVRRTFPFVPALAGRARCAATVDGVRVDRGQRVVLDVPGTNSDPRQWTAPEEFTPDRFVVQKPSPFAFVPQGGGSAQTGHRCPGEPLTVKLMAETLRVFADVDFSVTGESAHATSRIPTAPPHGLRIEVSDGHARKAGRTASP